MRLEWTLSQNLKADSVAQVSLQPKEIDRVWIALHLVRDGPGQEATAACEACCFPTNKECRQQVHDGSHIDEDHVQKMRVILEVMLQSLYMQGQIVSKNCELFICNDGTRRLEVFSKAGLCFLQMSCLWIAPSYCSNWRHLGREHSHKATAIRGNLEIWVWSWSDLSENTRLLDDPQTQDQGLTAPVTQVSVPGRGTGLPAWRP